MAIILRDYQVQMKSDIYSAWNSGHRNILAVKPTGLGKTKTFCSIAKDIGIDRNVPTAILVHRKELVEQISLTLAEEGIVHNIIAPRADIKGIIGAQRQFFKQQFYDYNGAISVVSVDTLNARIKNHENWAKKIGLWITDEAAHLLRDNKWGIAVSFFPNARGLGVTATPRRLDKRGLGKTADGVFDAMVEGPTTAWGIAEGFLCRYKIAVPLSDYKNHLRKASEGSDYSKEAMRLASLNSQIVGDVVKSYKQFANGKQTIVFSSDISEGQRLESAYRAAGINAKLLTGDTDKTVRRNSLVDFRERKLRVLINVDLFDEGLDVPGIECVQMARPTMSMSKYLQMCGRGMRPVYAPGFSLTTAAGRNAAMAASEKPHCIIIDHVGNVSEHGLPDTPRRWTLDRVIKRHDMVNLMRFCGNPKCHAPYDRLLTECPWCHRAPDYSGGRGAGGTKKLSLEQVDGDLHLLDPEQIREMEQSAVLETPLEILHRVSRFVGEPAGRSAMKKQQERIDAQKELAEIIARWCGTMKHHYHLGDRSINKKFYLEYGMTITQALSEPKADMLSTMDLIRGAVK